MSAANSRETRIRLRQKDEGVVDDRLVSAVEVVVPESPVAGEVHGEHEKTPLAGQVRVDHRFDRGDGDAYGRGSLDAFEDLFREARLAGGHLELGAPGDAVHGG